MMNGPVVCDLYCRVSTAEQAAEGYSLQEQEERLRAYAASQGWTVNACHIDPGYSGAKLDRPGLQQVIRDAEAGRINKVVTYKLDRLSRSQKDTLFLIEDVFGAHGVDYVSMTESFNSGSPFGKATLGLLSVFAQLEREQIKERMSMGRDSIVKEGRWHGGGKHPIGYRYVPATTDHPGRLDVDPYGAEVVRWVYAEALKGRSLNGIAHDVVERFPGLGRTTYSNSLVNRILRNPIYTGRLQWKGKTYDGSHPAIIDDDTFARVQAILAAAGNTAPPRSDGHLLTGLLFCACCGAPYDYRTTRHKATDGHLYVYSSYSCRRKNHKTVGEPRCPSRYYTDHKIEGLVWEQVEALDLDDVRTRDDDRSELRAAEAKLADVTRQQERLLDAFTVGALPVELLQKRAEELQELRQKLSAQVDALQAGDASPVLDLQALARVREIRASGSMEDQRALLRALIKRITAGGDQVVIEWRI